MEYRSGKIEEGKEDWADDRPGHGLDEKYVREAATARFDAVVILFSTWENP